MAQLLNAGLDKREIAVVLELIEAGINPESIADCKLFSLLYKLI
jgi:hypothetical protein